MGGLVLDGFREGLLGRAKITVPKHLVDLDADPFIPKGWSVPEGCHQKGGIFTWGASKVSLYLSESQKEGKWTEGKELRKDLAGKPVFNANLLDYLLKNPHLIPEEWNDQFVFFWGTIYRVSDDGLCVRCLRWYDGRWNWLCRWLVYAWRADYPAAVSES